MKFKTRLIIGVVVAWLLFGVMFFNDGYSAFFTQLGVSPLTLEEVTYEQVQKGRAVQGECYVVYDMIGYEYTEETDKYTKNTSTTTNFYYWLVDCGDDLMLVKTRARDAVSDTMQDMVDTYWDSETWDDYIKNFTGAAELDGVFIKNDDDMVSYAQSWLLDMEEADSSWKELRLTPYTLDCTESYANRIRDFYIGSAMLVVAVIAAIIAAVLFFKSLKGGSNVRPAPAGGFGIPAGGSYDTYSSGTQPTYGTQSSYGTQPSYGTQASSDAQPSYGTTPSAATYGTQQGANAYGDTFSSQNSYGTSGSTFRTQSGSSYGTSGSSFQTQGGSSYGTSGSTFRTQGGSSYGTSGSSFRTQNDSSYGTSGSTFWTQNGSSYGTSGSTTAGDYKPQIGTDYRNTL